MSNTEIKYDKFWIDFKNYCKAEGYNFKFGTTGKPYSRKISTGFKPAHITVRGNSDDNYWMCKIRFGQGSGKAGYEETEFLNYLENFKSEIEFKIRQAPQFGLSIKIEWIYMKKSKNGTDKKIKPMMDLSCNVPDIFDGDRDKYFNWLAHNADLYLRVFKEYYDKYKDDKEKQTL